MYNYERERQDELVTVFLLFQIKGLLLIHEKRLFT